MSLTGFLKASGEIRTLLREHFPPPRTNALFPALRATPLTTNYAMIGQAFDYLLRFHIQRHNPSASKESSWVANLINATLSDEDEETIQQMTEEAAALPYLELAHQHHQQYLEDGEITDDLLESCLNLAIMDGLVRAGEMRGLLGARDPKDLQDLRNLHALIPTRPFLEDGLCVLNPAFSFPGGADCDLLVGETLIEIKTTKFSQLKQEYYQQILGYYLINLGSERPRTIQRIGVYFSRHGYLWSTDVNTIASPDAFLRFLPTWQEHVQRYYNPNRLETAASSSTLSELIAQVDAFNGMSAYQRWLAQLSDADFAVWSDWPTALYYVSGAIEMEREKRTVRRSSQPDSL